jgi:hypothetical protein
VSLLVEHRQSGRVGKSGGPQRDFILGGIDFPFVGSDVCPTHHISLQKTIH